MAWKIKQNDTRPAYKVTLYQDYGTPSQSVVDLTDATEVLFLMRKASEGDPDAPEVSEAASIVAPATGGIVQYDWQPGDTAITGVYYIEFQVTWDDGGVETYPNEGYNSIEVVEDLG